jgi:hypothetical protein
MLATLLLAAWAMLAACLHAAWSVIAALLLVAWSVIVKKIFYAACSIITTSLPFLTQMISHLRASSTHSKYNAVELADKINISSRKDHPRSFFHQDKVI